MAEISKHPDSAGAQPKGIVSASPKATVPPEPPGSSDEQDELRILKLRTSESEPEDNPDDIPVIVSVALSTTAVGFYTSLAFHLLTWGAIAVVAGWIGLDWVIPDDTATPPLMAALGEEDFEDELPQLDLSGEEAIVMDTPASTIEQIAEQLQKSDSGWLRSTEEVALKSIVGSESANPDTAGSGVLLKVPKSGLAVTKGSFTAFTIPASPKPGETYAIVIEVRLPEDIKKFRVADLSGEVKGSDRYTQKLPYDGRTPNAAGYPVENQKIKTLDASTVLDVVDSKVQIVVKVPGAARLVKDTITIRSRKLRESQELTLVFGSAAPKTEEGDGSYEMEKDDSESDSGKSKKMD